MSKPNPIVGTTTLLFVTFLMTGCASPYRPSVYPMAPLTIKTTQLPDGSTESWQVRGGWIGPPALKVSEKQVRQVARLGIKCSILPRDGGTDGTPEGGITIAEVVADSPAERAGLAKGDTLLQVDGQGLNSGYALREHIEQLTDIGQAVELTVCSRSPGETPEQASDPWQVQVVPEPVEVTETETDSTFLHHSWGVQHYTGLQAATVPAEQAKSLYGTNERVLLVTGVVSGSPAYYAGLRAGDRVLTIDGGPASLDELRVAVCGRVIDEGYALMPIYDLLMFEDEHRFGQMGVVTSPWAIKFHLEENDQRESEDAPLVLEVDGPLGPHHAVVPLTTDNLDNATRTNLPGILTSRSTVSGTDVQFLDPGFTIGFDYRSFATDSSTREPVHNLSLQLLPFGMFEVRKFPNEDVDEVTLFWFLTF
ncbi:MAG: PDZ domain-containing protein [Planctomycetota bacterium]|nr:PDZ domain-containing protein [Planctomycetota bacterium]